MARPALRIAVSTKDQKELRKFVSGGVQQVVRARNRAPARGQFNREQEPESSSTP